MPLEKKKKEEGKIESSRSYSLGGLVCLAHFPTSQVTLGTLVVSWLKC